MTEPAAPPFHLTAATRQALRALATLPPDAETYPAALADLADLGASTVSMMLDRLETRGWMVSRVESAEDARAAGLPRSRRFYRLTDTGRAGMEHLEEWLSR